MQQRRYHLTDYLPLMCLAISCLSGNLKGQEITGELKVWHAVTLTFEGPMTSESAQPNPFSDYRLEVTFTRQGHVNTVPGYYAADGNASETSATSGNRWRVHFAPDTTGEWTYVASFVEGTDVAVNDSAGTPIYPDGVSGVLHILPSDKASPDFRAGGRLDNAGDGYLKHAGSGAYFLKAGADSPETLLAYNDFDQTLMMEGGWATKDWNPHLADWHDGDPFWQQDKGKGLIGAVNYLSEQGQNAISFLTMNIGGDGRNVWPYTDTLTFDRFDCSKLDQWEIVFAHCDHKGVALHFKTQEQENDQLLDHGELGRTRTLYYRELIARYAHHLGVTWDLGEENSNTDAQRKAFARYFFNTDPYHHPVVVHTVIGEDQEVYTPLLGDSSDVSGASLQADWNNVHALTLKWVQRSHDAGKPWIVANDEQGGPFIGVPTDGFAGFPSQDDIRQQVLWGNLMAGGAGVEYFFGYALPENDLSCEDFRPRENMWRYNAYALHFFRQYVPFQLMHSVDTLVVGTTGPAYGMALEDSVYVVYLSHVGTSQIDLSQTDGDYEIFWYNPREGGTLQTGHDTLVGGGGIRSLGLPPDQYDLDWVALVRRSTGVPQVLTLDCAPRNSTSNTLIWYPFASTNYVIESSPDDAIFSEVYTVSSDSCGERCLVHVPATGQITYYRLHTSGTVQYSNIVGCQNPIYTAKPTIPRQTAPTESRPGH